VRSVSLYKYGFVTLFGHPDDLSTAEMLFTALLVHATKQMALSARAVRPWPRCLAGHPGRITGRTAPERQAPEMWPLSAAQRNASRPSYRRSFLLAYASRIGARLREAAASATDAAVESDRKFPAAGAG